jgi:hypothetical protein
MMTTTRAAWLEAKVDEARRAAPTQFELEADFGSSSSYDSSRVRALCLRNFNELWNFDSVRWMLFHASQVNHPGGFLARMMYDEEHVDYFACGTEAASHTLKRVLFWSVIGSMSYVIQIKGLDPQNVQTLDAALQSVEDGGSACDFEIFADSPNLDSPWARQFKPETNAAVMVAALRTQLFRPPVAATSARANVRRYKRVRLNGPPSPKPAYDAMRLFHDTHVSLSLMMHSIKCGWLQNWVAMQLCVLAHACNETRIWKPIKRELWCFELLAMCRSLLLVSGAAKRKRFVCFCVSRAHASGRRTWLDGVVWKRKKLKGPKVAMEITLPAKIEFPHLDYDAFLEDKQDMVTVLRGAKQGTVILKPKTPLLACRRGFVSSGNSWETYVEKRTIDLVDMGDVCLFAFLYLGAIYVEYLLRKVLRCSELGIATLVCDYCDAFNASWYTDYAKPDFVDADRDEDDEDEQEDDE